MSLNKFDINFPDKAMSSLISRKCVLQYVDLTFAKCELVNGKVYVRFQDFIKYICHVARTASYGMDYDRTKALFGRLFVRTCVMSDEYFRFIHNYLLECDVEYISMDAWTRSRFLVIKKGDYMPLTSLVAMFAEMCRSFGCGAEDAGYSKEHVELLYRLNSLHHTVRKISESDNVENLLATMLHRMETLLDARMFLSNTYIPLDQDIGFIGHCLECKLSCGANLCQTCYRGIHHGLHMVSKVYGTDILTDLGNLYAQPW
jgi:hypothetical protein